MMHVTIPIEIEMADLDWPFVMGIFVINYIIINIKVLFNYK